MSAISNVKGSLDLVRAFAALSKARTGASLVMVGEGTAMDACQRLSLELGVDVLFVGAKPYDSVPLWLAAADVFVLPSLNEGTPNVVLEALACGRRVVATRVGGTPDLVTSDTLGTLVRPGDPPALAVALEEALSRPYDPEVVSAALDAADWRSSARRLHASLVAACAGRAASRQPKPVVRVA